MLLLQSYYLNLLLQLIILPTLLTLVMKSSIRCCISCIFPCGALDVIRIVHSNGRVEEITGTIFASDIMKSHPKHILKEPISRPLISDDYYFSSSSSSHYQPPSTKLPRIIIVPPDTQLQRGKIYFLIPAATTSNFKRNNQQQTKLSSSSSTSPNTTTVDNPIRNTTEQHDHHHHHDHQRRRRRRRQSSRSVRDGSGDEFCNNKIKTGFDSESGDNSITTHRRQQLMNSSSSISDRYLSELLSENKVSTHRDRRRRGRVAVWRPHLESICESVTDSGGSSTTTSTDHRRHHSHQL